MNYADEIINKLESKGEPLEYLMIELDHYVRNAQRLWREYDEYQMEELQADLELNDQSLQAKAIGNAQKKAQT